MNNTRLSTALHILSLLAHSEGDLLTSEWIAGSIGVNPVIVRKEMAVLKKAGLVESLAGKEGGTRLAKPAQKIKLSEVYQAVQQATLLGKKNLQPNPNCPVGKKINDQLEALYAEAEEKLMKFLAKKTLAEFSSVF
ncbi:MAG: transcriptional regulator [Bacteroidetes bacterium 43-16]|nr:MAG: transcriptional regulator [Bacteroidetes bacterium 43-16]